LGGRDENVGQETFLTYRAKSKFAATEFTGFDGNTEQNWRLLECLISFSFYSTVVFIKEESSIKINLWQRISRNFVKEGKFFWKTEKVF